MPPDVPTPPPARAARRDDVPDPSVGPSLRRLSPPLYPTAMARGPKVSLDAPSAFLHSRRVGGVHWIAAGYSTTSSASSRPDIWSRSWSSPSSGAAAGSTEPSSAVQPFATGWGRTSASMTLDFALPGQCDRSPEHSQYSTSTTVIRVGPHAAGAGFRKTYRSNTSSKRLPTFCSR